MLTTRTPQKKGSDRDSFLFAFGLYGAVGFQLAIAVVAGLLLGQWLDRRWNTTPWLMLLGLLLGAVGGFYNLIRIVNWKNRSKNP